MPMGDFQNNNLLHLTMDVWKDQVFLNGNAFPAGYFATAVLNMDEAFIRSLIEKGGRISFLIETLHKADRAVFAELLPQAKEAMSQLLDQLWTVPPYCFLDREMENDALRVIFSEEALDALLDQKSETRLFFFRYLMAGFSIPLGIFHYSWGCAYLIDHYLRRLKKRNETYFAAAAHDCFNSDGFWADMAEAPLEDIEAFTVAPPLSATFVFARHPKHKKETVFVTRYCFEAAVHFYTYDLLNGMAHGHAPHPCGNCGRMFLTTNGHTPRYCGGKAPQDETRTCRQYAAQHNQKEKNTEHPVYRLCAMRTNTIRKHHSRGKITGAERDAALRLAREYRERALMDDAYADDGYARDMELSHLYAEAKKKQ